MNKSSYFFIIGVFLLSLFLHFVAIDYPKEAVFDEVHFGKFVSGYLTGEYFFDIHPPLGKLMIAGMGGMTGFKPGFDFGTIGEQYPNNQYIWLRFLPALFGSLLIPLIYLLTLRLSGSARAAGLAAVFMLFENALLVQSKFILMDSFLLFFGFASIYFFLESRAFFNEGKWGIWASVVAATAGGLALSVKWTGASFLGLIFIFGFVILVKKILARRKRVIGRKELVTAVIAYVLMIVIPVVIYVVLFAIHFSLLPQKGPGNAYMNQEFQKSQERGFPAQDFFSNFYALNLEMLRSNQRITATHSYSSKWYTWPFMLRPIYYWNKDIAIGPNQEYEKIYLIGNPFVWWLATIVIIYFFLSSAAKGLWFVIMRWMRKRSQKLAHKTDRQPHIFTAVFLLTAYAVNFFPFIFIGRVMFLYHYLTALVFAIMIAAIALTSGSQPRKILMSFLVVGILCGFFVMFPITYGTILHASWPRYVFWLKSWI